MMKGLRWVVVVAAGALLAIALAPALASGNARTTVGSARAATAAASPLVGFLTGAEEVPPLLDVAGSAAAAITIDATTGETCVDMRVIGNLVATAAHVHRGARGQTGPVVIDLSAFLPKPSSAGCVTIAPALAAEIFADPAQFYVNIHSAEHPEGAMRGQLSASGTVTGQIHLLREPLRAFDSRNPQSNTGIPLPLLPPTPLAPGATATMYVGAGFDSAGALRLAVPPGAGAVLLRVTADQTGDAGWLKVYSADLATAPATASVNWYEKNSIVGADTTVVVDALGRIKVTAGVSSTYFIIDVFGYIY